MEILRLPEYQCYVPAEAIIPHSEWKVTNNEGSERKIVRCILWNWEPPIVPAYTRVYEFRNQGIHYVPGSLCLSPC